MNSSSSVSDVASFYSKSRKRPVKASLCEHSLIIRPTPDVKEDAQIQTSFQHPRSFPPTQPTPLSTTGRDLRKSGQPTTAFCAINL